MGNCNFATEIENPVKQGEKDHGCGIEIALIAKILYPADVEIVEILNISLNIKNDCSDPLYIIPDDVISVHFHTAIPIA